MPKPRRFSGASEPDTVDDEVTELTAMSEEKTEHGEPQDIEVSKEQRELMLLVEDVEAKLKEIKNKIAGTEIW